MNRLEQAVEKFLGINTMYKEPVAETVSRWKRTLRFLEYGQKPFAMFYLAGPEKKMRLLLKYVLHGLNIPSVQVIVYNAEPGQRDIAFALLRLAAKVSEKEGKRVAIIVRGFERAIAPYDDRYLLARFGHDWDQNVLGNPHSTQWGKLYRQIGKNVVILTVIDHSLGDATYEKAMRSAAGSQLHSGIIELEA